MVFMMLAGVSFALYFVAWRSAFAARAVARRRAARVPRRRARLDRRSISVYLTAHGTYDELRSESLRHTAFHVISVATTGGYAIADYAQWPPFAPVLMIAARLLRHLRRVDRRRHQDDPRASCC